jgi:MFS family permease
MTPLLPVYAAELGASPAVAGYFLSFSFLALAAGTLGAGWLSQKLQHRKMLIIVGGVVTIPILWLMGRVTSIWVLTALSATWYFSGGVALTLINILAGLFAQETERGRDFGILALTNPLGALAGGLATGAVADRWGFPTMFAVLALFGTLWPLAGLFLQDKPMARVQPGATAGAGERPGLGRSFALLFLASLVASVANFVFVMGRSVAMDGLGFAAAAISNTGAIGGAVTLPLPPLIGWLSDRIGRKQFLALCYLASAVGLLFLAVSVSLWHFWVASVLVSILMPVNMGVGSALVTDLVPRESVERGISLFNATTWMAGVVGFAGTGYAVQSLGMATTFVAGALSTLMAIVLLIPIRHGGRQKGVASTGGDTEADA